MSYSITMGELKANVLVSDTPWGLLCIYFHILALAITFLLNHNLESYLQYSIL